VQRTYDIALVLIRWLGLIAVIFGIMWAVNIVAAIILVVIRAPDWLLNPIWSYTAQGLLSGPIWLIVGIVILIKSERLAAFVIKHAKDDAS